VTGACCCSSLPVLSCPWLSWQLHASSSVLSSSNTKRVGQ
jgi:hypothetical protein